MEQYANEIKETHRGRLSPYGFASTLDPVVIGPVGDDLTYDYTAFGGTVNLTSRIISHSPPMSVLVTGQHLPVRGSILRMPRPLGTRRGEGAERGS